MPTPYRSTPVFDETTLPAGLRASGPGGDRIELRKVKERPAPSGSVWPAIPANFALKPADGAFEE